MNLVADGSMLADETIVCIQCGEDFIFAYAERRRFRERQFDDPKRCPDCRRHKLKLVSVGDRQQNHRRRERNALSDEWDM